MSIYDTRSSDERFEDRIRAEEETTWHTYVEPIGPDPNDDRIDADELDEFWSWMAEQNRLLIEEGGDAVDLAVR